jgi:hypothetical protein
VRTRATVAVLVAACLFYLGLIGWRGVILLGDDRWAARGLGSGVLLLPVVGLAVIVRELRFGRETGRLGRLLPGPVAGDAPEVPAPPGGASDSVEAAGYVWTADFIGIAGDIDGGSVGVAGRVRAAGSGGAADYGGVDAVSGGGGEEPVLVRRPSGRVDRTSADAVFAHRRAEVEAAPDDWRRWYRLAESYGDAGDTRRGRAAMRHAILLERRSR